MAAHVVTLMDPAAPAARRLKLDRLGPVVGDLPQLYQVTGERVFDVLFVDASRSDVTPAVATRLRRSNGLMEIWQLTENGSFVADNDPYLDGALSVQLGADGLRRHLEEILADKERLARYRMVGRSPRMKAVARTIERIAPTEVSVLIVGPSGSGKELVARALHGDSPRRDRPFVAINCGALAEGVLESELFGHERGAFTGSVARRGGLFRKAEGGTIFLDEIGETKPDFQVKLLRVLEDGTYYPVGSSTPLHADVRVLAATNRDLAEAIAERQFREDLYFRLGVVKIVLPPLRERTGDIQPLLQYFWADYPDLDFSDAALSLLMRYDWPGNVRQLRNFATQMAAVKRQGLVDTEDVERFIEEQHAHMTNLPVVTGRTVEEAGQELIYRAILSLGNEIRMLRELITANLPQNQPAAVEVHSPIVETATTMEEMEKALIAKVLRETGGNRKETARRLGIGERTLYRKLNKYNLS